MPHYPKGYPYWNYHHKFWLTALPAGDDDWIVPEYISPLLIALRQANETYMQIYGHTGGHHRNFSKLIKLPKTGTEE